MRTMAKSSQPPESCLHRRAFLCTIVAMRKVTRNHAISEQPRWRVAGDAGWLAAGANVAP